MATTLVTYWVTYYHPDTGVKYFGAATPERAFEKANEQRTADIITAHVKGKDATKIGQLEVH